LRRRTNSEKENIFVFRGGEKCRKKRRKYLPNENIFFAEETKYVCGG